MSTVTNRVKAIRKLKSAGGRGLAETIIADIEAEAVLPAGHDAYLERKLKRMIGRRAAVAWRTAINAVNSLSAANRADIDRKLQYAIGTEATKNTLDTTAS